MQEDGVAAGALPLKGRNVSLQLVSALLPDYPTTL